METLDLNAVARMGLILAHLLAFAMAAVGIAFGDLAIFRKRRVDADMLATSQTVVTWALYTLWATGVAVIWLDTRFDPAVVGVGKAVAPALGYTGFIVLYLAVVSLAIGVSLAFIRPILAARMLRPEPVHTVIAEHARKLLGPFADDFLAENGVRAADIERNPARAVVRIGKLLEEIDPAHREAFDRLTARKLHGELAEAS